MERGKAESNSYAINMNRFAFLEADSVGRISGTVDSCTPVRELLY